MGMEVNTSELELLLEGLNNLSSKVLEDLAWDFESQSTDLANIQKGTLKASIQAQQTSDLSWIVGTNIEYAPYVHEGFPAHEIKATNAKALSFPDGNFYKRVWHPGYVGNPFFDDTTDIIEAQLEKYLELAMGDIK
jgi:hypothetical protein